MVTTTVDIGTLITRREGVKGGRPIIAGTGMTVLAVVDLYQQGVSPEEILREHFPQLTMDKVFAALAYWKANEAEIDGWFRRDEEAEAAWFRERGEVPGPGHHPDSNH